MQDLSEIVALIEDGKLDEAIGQLDKAIGRNAEDDQLYFLRGKAYQKVGNWQEALQNYLEAMHLNPDSPASEAYKMAQEILEFYNKDSYNP